MHLETTTNQPLSNQFQQAKTVQDFLQAFNDPRKDALLRFHEQHLPFMETAKGSASKHQAWVGGYLDHLGECFRIARAQYVALSEIRPLPFRIEQAFLVLYLHDVEKIWKYGSQPDLTFDKASFLQNDLRARFGITLDNAEQNALKYIHGEPEAEYSPYERLVQPLGAFCHAVDHLSARMWFDEGKGLG